MVAVFSGFSVWVLIAAVLCLLRRYLRKKVPLAEISRVCHLECLQNKSEDYAESEACDSASVVPIHTRSEVSSDSDSAYDSASVASVVSVNQPLVSAMRRHRVRLNRRRFNTKPSLVVDFTKLFALPKFGSLRGSTSASLKIGENLAIRQKLASF